VSFATVEGVVMDFYAVLDQVVTPVASGGRLTYQALTYQFQLDEAGVEALKAEPSRGNASPSMRGQGAGVERRSDSTGNGETGNRKNRSKSSSLDADAGTDRPRDPDWTRRSPDRRRWMFCDLVGSTTLAERR